MLLHDAFHTLTALQITQITKEHWELMGIMVFIYLVYAKVVLDDHCCIVAAEEPQILVHADDCRYPTACKEDWHATWWNEMGCFLLDRQNPHPCDPPPPHCLHSFSTTNIPVKFKLHEIQKATFALTLVSQFHLLLFTHLCLSTAHHVPTIFPVQDPAMVMSHSHTSPHNFQCSHFCHFVPMYQS